MTGTKTLCTICNLVLNSYEQYVVHQAGKSHKRREKSAASGGGVPPAQPVTKIVRPNTFINFVTGQNQDSNTQESAQSTNQDVVGSSDASQTDNSTHNGSGDAVPQNNDGLFCKTCVVKLTSQSQADIHYSGSKHRRAVALAATAGDTSQGTKRKLEDMCEVCNVPLRTKAVADAHYAGAKHVKKLKLSHNITNTPKTSCPPFSVINTQATPQTHPRLNSGVSFPSQTPLFSSPTTPLRADGKPSKPVQAGSMFFCNFCNISVNSQMQMDAHREGTKHKNIVSGLAPQRKPFTPRLPPPPPQQDNYGFMSGPPQDNSRFLSPIMNSVNNFQAGNFRNPTGPMPFRPGPPLAYSTPQY